MSARVAATLFKLLLLLSIMASLRCGSGPKSAFPPSSQLAQICNTVDAQRRWVRSYMDEAYLWYSEIPSIDASNYGTPTDYFNALLVRKPTASGKPRDQFSFTYPADAFDNLINAGVEASYGIEWAIVPHTRIIRVAYVEPGSPAALASVRRGATILSVNGNDVNTMPTNPLVDALYPSDIGVQTTFRFSEINPSAVRDVRLTSANVTKSPVPTALVLDTPSGKTGYLVFNDHLATAEDPLVQAVDQFKAAGINSLVLDMRYNGGGYLYIADELAAMIGGDRVSGKVFEKLQYNDKRTAETNASVILFRVATEDQQRTLPKLGLSRIYVLTDSGTCSASESVINGLAPFVEVVLIGHTTCGKPYGFLGKDNCGTAYFPIEFQGTNAAGFGDYADGFAPNETMLAAALVYQATGSCPAAGQVTSALPISSAQLFRSPVRENRILKE